MPKVTKKVVNDSDSSDVDEVIEASNVKKATPVKKAAPKKAEPVPEPKPEPSEEEDSDDSDDSDNEEEEQSSSEDEEEQPKKKKVAESFETVNGRLEERAKKIKELYKQKNEKYKELKDLEKQINSLERGQTADRKLLEKSHNDDLKEARKKPKRKGNVNGGFNKEHPVPEVLRKFLGQPEGTKMSRPKVMSALNNKFKELGLKDKQVTKLDKKTAKELGLDGPTEIEFGEFQKWLASFYPKEKVEVNV